MKNQKILEIWGARETVDAALNPLVLMWLKEKARQDPAAFCRFSQDNQQRLSRLLGPGIKTQGPRKEAGLLWVSEELGSPLFIFSSPEGTIWKLHYPGGERSFASDRKMGSLVTGLMERYLQALSGTAYTVSHANTNVGQVYNSLNSKGDQR